MKEEGLRKRDEEEKRRLRAIPVEQWGDYIEGRLEETDDAPKGALILFILGAVISLAAFIAGIAVGVGLMYWW